MEMRSRKKQSSWKRILLWSSLGLAIILIASVFVMDYAVDKVLRSMSGMDTILSEDVADDSVDVSPSAKTNVDVTEVADTPSSKEDTSGDEIPTEAASNTNEAVNPKSSDSSEPSPQPDQTTTGTTYKAEISTERAKALEEDASLAEKATVASLLMKNLSAGDIKLLTSLASGGLNLEEKKAARTLILEKFTEEEYNELISIAAKFGVSQGKQYDEVIKEE